MVDVKLSDLFVFPFREVTTERVCTNQPGKHALFYVCAAYSCHMASGLCSSHVPFYSLVRVTSFPH